MKVQFLVLTFLSLLLASVQAQTSGANTTPVYTISDAGIIPGYAWDINDRDQMVGNSFLWAEHLGLLDLAILTARPSVGYAINNAGQIAGAFYIDGALPHAFLWTTSTAGIQDLGTLPGGDFSVGLALNELGKVAGYSNSAPNSNTVHAVLWTAVAGIQDLGTLPGGDSCEARGINNAGKIVGYCRFADDPLIYHAFLWAAGSGIQDLGTLPGGNFSEAYAINQEGQVVGRSNVPLVPPQPGMAYTSHAFLWSEADGMEDLGALPGSYSATALAINDAGQVVGYSAVNYALTGSVAFIFERKAGLQDLNNLIPPYSGFLLVAATSVNRPGHIAVVGYVPGDGTFHALVLKPAAHVQQ